MIEKRKVKQIEKRNEFGELIYTIIPNYKAHENFMTENELKFYHFLIKVIVEIKERYELNLRIFAQVAVNRIIDVNNERKMNELFDKISMKSIDFVIFEENTNKIKCCIELDDETHQNEKRIERDRILDQIFKDTIKLIHIKRSEFYDFEETIKQIMQEV